MTCLSDFHYCKYLFANFNAPKATLRQKHVQKLRLGIMLNIAAQAISGAQFATCSTDAYIFVKFCKALLSEN